MQDTKNLKKKLKKYSKYLNDFLILNDHYYVNYWNGQIANLERRIKIRKKNEQKNRKQFKKAHGYFA